MWVILRNIKGRVEEGKREEELRETSKNRKEDRNS